MAGLVIITAIGVLLTAGDARAQATRVPAGLQVTLKSAEARLGAKVPVTIGLKNFKGTPTPANERVDVVLESSLPAQIEKVSIQAGKDSVTTHVVFKRAGIAKLTASSGKLTPGYGVLSVTAQAARRETQRGGLQLVAFRSPEPATAGVKLGLKALVSRVVPRNRLWTVTVLVAALNDQREGLRVTEDLPIRLASALGTVVPAEITIPRGESARFVEVQSKVPGLDTISALSPMADDRAEEKVEYEQPRATQLLLMTTPLKVVTNGRSSASITVLLRDEDGNYVTAPDRDTRVVLRTDFGSLSASSTTIAKGRTDSEPIVLLSPRAGRATITAIADGLSQDSDEVRFVLPFLLIGLAALGGVGGAALRAPRGRRRAQIGRSLALGAFLGTIFFAMATMGVPGMIPAIPLKAIEHLTLNEIGACLMGIFGGYIGRRFLDDLLIKKGKVATA